MVMNHGAVNEWTTFLELLRNSLAEVQTRLAETEAEAGRLEAQIQSVEDSIAAYREHHHEPALPLPLGSADGANMTLTDRRRQFLRATARRNGGRLVLREARDNLIQVGLFRDVRQYRQQIGRLLDEMDCWERIRGRRGVYRLVSPNGH